MMNTLQTYPFLKAPQTVRIVPRGVITVRLNTSRLSNKKTDVAMFMLTFNDLEKGHIAYQRPHTEENGTKSHQSRSFKNEMYAAALFWF